MEPATKENPVTVDATPWWADAVVYQIYPRSFADTNGDGVGDLRGIIDRLGYLELLGVNAIWLNPITVSPGIDHGYDVADPRAVDPLFGGLDEVDVLIRAAADHDIHILLDIVPNHTSDRHPWFQAALASAPGSPERARYHFADGRGEDHSEPPNNWKSVFGGPAWTRITEADGTPGQWYLHIFAAEQPDLNWENPEVGDDLEATLRFWLDRGVAGFRIDVAHGMAKPAGLPDAEDTEDATDPRFDDDAVHAIHRRIRGVLDEYPEAVAVGEVWVSDRARFADYLRDDELHLAFDFGFTAAPFEADALREAIDAALASGSTHGATPTWTLCNHDLVRPVTRHGLPAARALALVELALPGTAFLYYGDELGLPQVDLPDEALVDPVWERSGHTARGRDGGRVPMPWEGPEPPFGFSSSPDTWLPMPTTWERLTAEEQLEDVASTLSLYRAALELRSARPEFSGAGIEWFRAPDGCLAFRRPGGLVCALNTGRSPVPLPPGELLLVSAPLQDGKLPPAAAAWVVRHPEGQSSETSTSR